MSCCPRRLLVDIDRNCPRTDATSCLSNLRAASCTGNHIVCDNGWVQGNVEVCRCLQSDALVMHRLLCPISEAVAKCARPFKLTCEIGAVCLTRRTPVFFICSAALLASACGPSRVHEGTTAAHTAIMCVPLLQQMEHTTSRSQSTLGNHLRPHLPKVPTLRLRTLMLTTTHPLSLSASQPTQTPTMPLSLNTTTTREPSTPLSPCWCATTSSASGLCVRLSAAPSTRC